MGGNVASTLHPKQLLQEYCLGSRLGQGASGVVFTAVKRSTGAQYAVKQVDRLQMLVNGAQEEADILRRLAHPNIVKAHAAFIDKYFVYIVMDKYNGGNLLEAQACTNAHSITHISRQMVASIQYLHSRSIVHRDVRGENFWLSRKDLTNPRCLIALADFGLAVEITPGERLSQSVGTSKCLAPEVFKKDYGLKVDVWALGVLMYCMITGYFPFKDHSEICNRGVMLPEHVPSLCKDFIQRMLEKNEERRPSSEQVAAHMWVRGVIRSKDEEAGAEASINHEVREVATDKVFQSGAKSLSAALTSKTKVASWLVDVCEPLVCTHDMSHPCAYN